MGLAKKALALTAAKKAYDVWRNRRQPANRGTAARQRRVRTSRPVR